MIFQVKLDHPAPQDHQVCQAVTERQAQLDLKDRPDRMDCLAMMVCLACKMIITYFYRIARTPGTAGYTGIAGREGHLSKILCH